MSSPTSHRPTLACRLTRLRASLADQPPSGVRRHCATCADCRQYFDTVTALETRLRRSAAPARATAPATLEARILNAVDRSQREERRPSSRGAWGLAAVAAAALAAVIAFRIHPAPPVDASPEVASIEDVMTVASELPKQWLATLRPGAVKLLEANPLQTEIASVGSDARSALSFLALNFLPTNEEAAPLTEPVSQPRQTS